MARVCIHFKSLYPHYSVVGIVSVKSTQLKGVYFAGLKNGAIIIKGSDDAVR